MPISLSAATVDLDLLHHRFSGFADSPDAIVIGDIEMAKTTRGGDGRMQGHSTGHLGTTLTVMLQPISPSHAFLQQQAERQKANRGRGLIWAGTLRDPALNLVIRFESGILTQYTPGGSVGAGTAKDHTYIWDFERVISNYDGATLGIAVTAAVR